MSKAATREHSLSSRPGGTGGTAAPGTGLPSLSETAAVGRAASIRSGSSLLTTASGSFAQAPRLDLVLPSPSLQLWNESGQSSGHGSTRSSNSHLPNSAAGADGSLYAGATAGSDADDISTALDNIVNKTPSSGLRVSGHGMSTSSSFSSNVGMGVSGHAGAAAGQMSAGGAGAAGGAGGSATQSGMPFVFAKVRSDYAAKGPDELNLEEEDIVRILSWSASPSSAPSQALSESSSSVSGSPSTATPSLPRSTDERPGFLFGTINGISGWCPSSCVRLLSDEEAFAEGLYTGESMMDVGNTLNSSGGSGMLGNGGGHLGSGGGGGSSSSGGGGHEQQDSFVSISEALEGNPSALMSHQQQQQHQQMLSQHGHQASSASFQSMHQAQPSQGTQTRNWYNKYRVMPRYEKRAISASFLTSGDATNDPSSALNAPPTPHQRDRSQSNAGIISTHSVSNSTDTAPGHQAGGQAGDQAVMGHKSEKSWGSSFMWGTGSVRSQPPGSASVSAGGNAGPAAASNGVVIGGPGKVAILGAPAGQRQLWVDFMGGQEAVDQLGLTKKEIKRQEVIFEIITTESDYIDDLDIVYEAYIKQLKRNKLIRPKDMAIIFSNIEQLLPVNMELLKSLDKRQRENKVIQQVGDVFIRVSDYLKMYTMYCSNHPYALIKLQTVRQNKQVAKFLDQCAQLPECRNLNLANFLLKPVQRVCKYPLLLRELIKATEPDHPDSENLLRAHLKIETVVTIINEGARQTENVHKMLELQSKFLTKVNIVAPSRVMVKNGQVDVRNSQGETKRREVYLFNDMLVVAKPEGDKYKLIQMVPFDMIFVNSFHDNSDAEFQIEVVHVNVTHCYLVFDNPNTKEAWIAAIRNAVDDWMLQRTRMNAAAGSSAKAALSPRSGSVTAGNRDDAGDADNMGRVSSGDTDSAPGSSQSSLAQHASHADDAGGLGSHSSMGTADASDKPAKYQMQHRSGPVPIPAHKQQQQPMSSADLLAPSVDASHGAPPSSDESALQRRHTTKEGHAAPSSRSGPPAPPPPRRVPPPVPDHQQSASRPDSMGPAAADPTYRPPIFAPSPIALQQQKLKLQPSTPKLPSTPEALGSLGSLASPTTPTTHASRANNLIVQDKPGSGPLSPSPLSPATPGHDHDAHQDSASHQRASTTTPPATAHDADAPTNANGDTATAAGTDGPASQRVRSATESPMSPAPSSLSRPMSGAPAPPALPPKPSQLSKSREGSASPSTPVMQPPAATSPVLALVSSTSSPGTAPQTPTPAGMGRTNTAINKPVKAAKILDILRGTGAGPKAYTYSIAVTHIGLPDSQPPTLIQRTFDNFFDLHLQLVGHFPEAAGISTGAEVIRATTTTATTAAASPASGAGGGQAGQPPVKRILPELPGQMMFVSEAAARARTVQLQAYLDVLLTLPPKISRSPVVLKFFRSS